MQPPSQKCHAPLTTSHLLHHTVSVSLFSAAFPLAQSPHVSLPLPYLPESHMKTRPMHPAPLPTAHTRCNSRAQHAPRSGNDVSVNDPTRSQESNLSAHLAVWRPGNISDSAAKALSLVLDWVLGVVERPNLHHTGLVTGGDVGARWRSLPARVLRASIWCVAFNARLYMLTRGNGSMGRT